MGFCLSKGQARNAIFNQPSEGHSKAMQEPKQESLRPERLAAKNRPALVDGRKLSELYIEASTARVLDVSKSSKEIDIIKSSLSKHFIFRNLSQNYIGIIIHHMKLYSFKSSEAVFEQGQAGRNFYVVSKGKLEIVINSNRNKVITIGDSFGEMALLYDTPRTASVYTITNCNLWCLDRNTFRSTVQALEMANYEENRTFIDSIPSFSALTEKQKETLVHSLTSHNFTPGSRIVNEGDPGDLLYIIKEGVVIVTQNNKEVRRMTKGFHFGEQALLYSMARTASVTAVDNVKCVAISGQELTNVLGNKLQDIIYTNSIRISLEKNYYFSMVWFTYITSNTKVD